MRADAHYVEQLDAWSPPRDTAAERSAHHLGAGIPNFSDIERELTDSLSVVSLGAEMINEAVNGLSRSVATDLVRAEAWRASMLLQGSRVLRNSVSSASTAFSVPTEIARSLRGFEVLRRLRGLSLDVRLEIPPSLTMVGDTGSFGCAIAGLLTATSALLERVTDACISLVAAVEDVRLAIRVEQTSVSAPPSWQARAFDESWTDRPGGVTSAVGLLAARRISERLRGQLAVTTLPQGTRIVLLLPVRT
jgi:hypothetical protein